MCTAAPSACQDALSFVRRGGQRFVLGLCVEPVQTDLMIIVLGELVLMGGTSPVRLSLLPKTTFTRGAHAMSL